MAVQIQLRGGTAAQWASANPVLAERELVVETDTKKIKIGDGVTTYNNLPYNPMVGQPTTIDGGTA
jgi:hypothetical protein